MSAARSRSPSPEHGEHDEYSDGEEVPADQLVSTAKALYDQVCEGWRRLLEPAFREPVVEYHRLDLKILKIKHQLSQSLAESVRHQLEEKRNHLRRERKEIVRRTQLSYDAVALYLDVSRWTATLQDLDWGADDRVALDELSAADRELVADYLERASDVETDGMNVLEHHIGQLENRHHAVAARRARLEARRLNAAERRAERAGTTQSARRHTFERRPSRLSHAHVPSPSPEHDEARALGRARDSREGGFRRALLYYQREY